MAHDAQRATRQHPVGGGLDRARWSELRALRVRDFVEIPMPLLVVERAEPEGVPVKVTKSGRGRRVPVADRILPIVQELAQRELQ